MGTKTKPSLHEMPTFIPSCRVGFTTNSILFPKLLIR